MNEHIQITPGAILFKDSQDLVNSSSKWEWGCTWRISLSRFNLLNMVVDQCGHTIECKWMLKRCIQPRLIMEQCCTWRTSSYLHLGIPSETWLWLLTDVIVWMHLNEHQKDVHHQDWLWDHLFWKSKAHFTAWIWVINWTSLMRPIQFFLQSNSTSWEESLKKNIEHSTKSLVLQAMRCMFGRLDSFQED